MIRMLQVYTLGHTQEQSLSMHSYQPGKHPSQIIERTVTEALTGIILNKCLVNNSLKVDFDNTNCAHMDD